MLDTIIKGALLIDGSGEKPYNADIAVKDGVITEIGSINCNTKQVINADGAWVTPGFIDIHTHFDGQASWDQTLSPSIYHGVTTVVMGNCGVGFAPLKPGEQDRLIRLMEGVEDIPGVALSEGIDFRWESFPEYMEAIDSIPHSLDFAMHVPHDPLRMYVMGERAIAQEAATADDIATMKKILRHSLEAGAIGFSTGRSDNHRTSLGEETPASEATSTELSGLASAFQGLNHGVVQIVSDFDLFKGKERFDVEFDLVEDLARMSGRPLSMTWMQRDPGGDQYKAIAERVEKAVAKGLPLYLQTAARGIGVIVGLEASFHIFVGFPSFRKVARLPLAERAAAMRDPEFRKQILSEQSMKLSGDGSYVPPLVDIILNQIEMIAARMFPLKDNPNYEPTIQDSFFYQAKMKGVRALEVIYDYLSEGDGKNLIYFPIFNYNEGSLDVVRQMFDHPQCLMGLSDAGAHVGTICDASFSTFMLSYWGNKRGKDTLPIEKVVHMLSAKNGRYLGLKGRGLLNVGMRADINIIDPLQLNLPLPKMVYDLPAGGKRLLQKANGYLATYVKGELVQQQGEITNARPGRLIRMN